MTKYVVVEGRCSGDYYWISPLSIVDSQDISDINNVFDEYIEALELCNYLNNNGTSQDEFTVVKSTIPVDYKVKHVCCIPEPKAFVNREGLRGK